MFNGSGPVVDVVPVRQQTQYSPLVKNELIVNVTVYMTEMNPVHVLEVVTNFIQ